MKTKKIIDIINAHIIQEQGYINEHEQIKVLLSKVEGKQFNLRTLNKKLLGEFKFASRYGMFYIEGKFSHLIGYHSSESISVERFAEWDACHGTAAQQRINQLKNMDVKKLTKVFNKVDKHFSELRSAFGEIESERLGSFYNPVYYSLLQEIQGYKDESSKIRLTDFYYIRTNS